MLKTFSTDLWINERFGLEKEGEGNGQQRFKQVKIYLFLIYIFYIMGLTFSGQ